MWEGVDPAEAPAVTFELLANGEPALGMDQKVLADQVITLEPGTTTYTWTDLPTQHTKGEALMYSVREVEIEGFESTGNTSYFVPLDQPDEVGSITITNTAVPGDEPTEEPTEEPVPEPVTEPVLESKDELETKMQTVAGQYRYRVSAVHFVEDAAKNYTLSADQLDGENGYRFYKTAKVTFDFIRSDWGVAELGCHSHNLIRLRRMGDEFNFKFCF